MIISITRIKAFAETPSIFNEKNALDLKLFRLPNYSIHAELDSFEIPEKNLVFGKKMEKYFEVILANSGEYEIIAKNIQIYENKITLGELDFLVKNVLKNTYSHIELVCKFYVFDPSFENEIEGWIGPNRKDTLLQKVEKLKHKQLPLLYNPETEKFLEKYHLIASNFNQEVCFKAKLFVPKALQNKTDWKINSACISGYWIRYEQFNTEYSAHLFLLPPKEDWPIPPETGELWVSYSAIKKQILLFFSKKKSPLVWMKKGNSIYEKFFVVWW